MRFPGWRRQWILITVGIGLPWLLAVLLNLFPQPLALSTHWQRFQSAQERRRSQNAATEVKAILELQPWRTDLWVELGRLQIQRGAWQEAVTALETAKKLPDFPGSGEYLLGEAYSRTERPERALAIWKSLMESGSAPPELYPALASLQRALGDIPGAIQTLRAWQKDSAGDPRPPLELGFLLAIDNPGEAVQELDRASALDRTLTGQVYPLRKALKNDGCMAGLECQMQVGRALAAMRQWDLAGKVFEEVTRREPGNAEAWAFLGEARQHNGQDGLPALEMAENLDSHSIIVKAMKSLYWRRQGKLETALVFLRELAVLEPEEATWQIDLGNTLAENGSLIEALECFEKGVLLEPENPLTWANLARFSADYQVEIKTTGLKAARQYILLKPGDPEALDLMGRMMMALEDMDSAERFLQQALQADDSFPVVYLHLGQLYLQIGAYDSAYDNLVRCAGLSQDDDAAGFIAKRLLARYFPGGDW